jgi:hypothetical protein
MADGTTVLKAADAVKPTRSEPVAPRPFTIGADLLIAFETKPFRQTHHLTVAG